MAKRRRRGYRGLKGLGNLRRPGAMREIVPPVIGGVLALGTALGIRAFVKPETPAMAKLYEWAPLAGVGAGALGAGALFAMTRSGGPAVSAMLSAGLVGGGLLASEALNAQRAAAAVAAVAAMPAGETGGLAALVPETVRGLQGVVMEPVKGMYGETVRLNGTVNPSAFGREAYRG